MIFEILYQIDNKSIKEQELDGLVDGLKYELNIIVFVDFAKYYDKAANYEPNKFYSPTYLMKAALAYEKLNQNDKAKEAYSKIITDFWDSQEYQNAVKLKARLETNS